jgi:hypothetical protein
MRMDPKGVIGVLTAVLGWLVTAGPTIVPTLPEGSQRWAGAVVTAAGVILSLVSNPPTKGKSNG